MKFEIDLNDEDYINFNIYHAFHSKMGKKSILLGRLMVFFLSCLAIIIFFLEHAEKGLILTEAILLMIVSVIYFFYYPRRAKKRIRKNIYQLKKEGALPYSTNEIIEFTDTEILEESKSTSMRSDYSEISTIHASDEYLYLYKGAIRAIILPYRCLGDQKEEVIAFLRSKVTSE